MGNFGIFEEVLQLGVNVVYGGKSSDIRGFVLDRTKSMANMEEVLDRTAVKETDGLVIADYDSDIYYLWVKDYKKTEVLVHEIYHLVNLLLGKLRGIKPDENTEELYAYYAGWWFTKITEGIKKEIKRKKKKRS